jgi:hypothetical protein
VKEFEKPIGRVWRRMRAQRFLTMLVWCWCICLALTAIAVGVDKLTPRHIAGPPWAPFAVAGGLGFVIAALIAACSGPSRVDAAVAIDLKFHLNERLSTTLTLPEDLRATPAGRALVADTLKHINGLDIPSKFGLCFPKRAWAPLIPGAIAVGLLFVNELTDSIAKASHTTSTETIKKETVVKQANALKKAVKDQRKDIDKNQYTETDKLLAQIEKAADKLAASPPAEKDKAMVELNKLTDALKERQKQLGSTDQINRQLQQMKEMASNGPADDFAKDLGKGDFQKAAQELQKLQEKLASGKLNKEEKKALEKQMADMKQQLEKLANFEQRKKQLEEARKNGGLTKEQFEQQMAKLNEQAKDMQKLQKLANQLGAAQDALQKGDSKKAAEALGMGQKQLEQLAQQASELQTLDQAMADLQDAKNGMANDGMNQIGEQLAGANNLGMNRRPGNGNGMGRGRGQGDRPEAPDDTRSYDSKTNTNNLLPGKAILTGEGPKGKQTKGFSMLDVQGETEAAGAAATEALSNQKIPNSIKKHVTNYFDQIRKGN